MTTLLDRKHLALVGLLLVLGFCWLRAHDAWRDAESFKRGQADAIQQDRTAFSKAQQHSDQTAKQEIRDVAVIQKHAAKPASRADIDRLLTNLLHTKVETVQGPNGPPMLAIEDTQENRQQIVQVKAQCDICQVKLAARDSQFQDAQAQLTAKKDELARVSGERDKFEKAASAGHGFWARTEEWAIRAGIAGAFYGAGRLSKK